MVTVEGIVYCLLIATYVDDFVLQSHKVHGCSGGFNAHFPC